MLCEMPIFFSLLVRHKRFLSPSFYISHDWINYQVDRSEGVRILTVFFYLNTVAEDGGGGTRFPKLDLTVQPVRGSALIWPSTLDDKPNDKDPRTNHQAMPVLKGIKYGAVRTSLRVSLL